RVLDGDAGLVVVAVQHPLLELALGQLPVVHQDVIAVVVVVAGGSFPPEPLHQLVARERRPLGGAGHRVTARPSAATSHPAPPARAAVPGAAGAGPRGGGGWCLWGGGNPPRPPPGPAGAAGPPPAPPMGRCAMAAAGLVPRPCPGSSSSDQNVPSKKAQSA